MEARSWKAKCWMVLLYLGQLNGFENLIFRAEELPKTGGLCMLLRLVTKCGVCRITLSLELTRYKNICTLSSSLKGHWQVAQLQQKHKSCSNSLFHHHFSWPVVSHTWVEWRKSRLGFNLDPQYKWVFKKQSHYFCLLQVHLPIFFLTV